MILAIDTSSRNILKLALYWPSKLAKTFEFQSQKKSQTLLFYINRALRQNKLKLNDLKLIAVNIGPGSFTGLRVGATIANTLSYVLKIPIIGIKEQINPLQIARQAFQKFKKNQIKPGAKVQPIYDQID